MSRLNALPIVCLVFGLASASASAQDRFDLQTFLPAVHADQGTFVTESARLLAPGHVDARLVFSHGDSPFTLIRGDGEVEGQMVAGISELTLTGAAGLHERVAMGIALPLRYTHAGVDVPGERDIPLAESVAGLGDVRLVPLIAVIPRADTDLGLALSVSAGVLLPTGDVDAYAGDDGVRVDPRVHVDYGLASGHHLIANVGYRVRPTAEVPPLRIDDAVGFSLGGRARVHSQVDLMADLFGSTLLGDDVTGVERPLEGLAGAAVHYGPWRAQVGAGGSLSSAVGAPDWRVVGGVGVHIEPNPDPDGDGILRRDDLCPQQPEDLDSFEDADGCPDLDNDGDGVLDTTDACALEPEDRDGFADADGCPEDDNDGDGILDADDACRDEAEDLDGLQDEDGCPEDDADGDGFPDASDACPSEAGPDEGCPAAEVEPEPEPVQLPQDAEIYFDFDTANLRPESEAALRAFVAESWVVDPSQRLRVEGHTDAIGEAQHNDELSQERADAVRAVLIDAGVPEGQVEAIGFGASRPAYGAGESERNRRVHIFIE